MKQGDISRAKSAAMGAGIAIGAVAGAASAIDQIARYPSSYSNIGRWLKECFLTAGEIDQTRNSG